MSYENDLPIETKNALGHRPWGEDAKTRTGAKTRFGFQNVCMQCLYMWECVLESGLLNEAILHVDICTERLVIVHDPASFNQKPVTLKPQIQKKGGKQRERERK